MTGGSQFLTQLLHSSSRSSLLKPSRPFFYNSIKNYGQQVKEKQSHLVKERASSTADEFLRVAEEKANETPKVKSQTIDKTIDAAEEATKSNTKFEDVKNRYKDH
ncbi:hypothetical protein TSUD_129640 [Trifolium subterraneum]|uniref:Uncharacterized protein n=1 Tax=Trifolium subterraneum TaxID=3900 RepID=A0A2Z6MB50_TRISU|nr:hypothetical protein TSUD_129640 [Trifolium subterraneum]